MNSTEASKILSDMKSGKITWDDNLKAQADNAVNSTGTSGAMNMAKQVVQLQQDANKPAIESLQAQNPEISAKYAQTKSQLEASQVPLEKRYQNLLDEIKGKQTADVNSQTKITSNELGKRGLTGSSTLAQQEIQNAVQPINTSYAGLSNETGLAREESIKALQDQIANLGPAEIADKRAIANAIAQLQSGAATQGISQGLNLYSTQVENDLQQQRDEETKKQNEIANALAQLKINTPLLEAASIGQNSTALYNPYTGQTVNTIKGLQDNTGGNFDSILKRVNELLNS